MALSRIGPKLAYKKNVTDIRESPSLELLELLEARGCSVDFYDPLIAEIAPTREHPALEGKKRIDWDLGALSTYDAVLIAMDHDDADYVSLSRAAKLVVDTRNCCSRAGADMDNVVRA